MEYNPDVPMVSGVPPKSTWHEGFWDCFSPVGDCLMASCCPCVLIGKTSSRMRDPSMQSYSTFNADCMLSCGINCLTGCGWIYAMFKRTELRERYNIEGSVMGDCCATFWCSCCVMVQSEKEARYRTQPAVPNSDGYKPMPKDGMVMPAPNQQV